MSQESEQLAGVKQPIDDDHEDKKSLVLEPQEKFKIARDMFGELRELVCVPLWNPAIPRIYVGVGDNEEAS